MEGRLHLKPGVRKRAVSYTHLDVYKRQAYMYNDVLGKLAGYCETLVSVSVIMIAAFTTGSLSKVRSKSRKVFVFENFPKPMQLVVTAVVAFGLSLIHI